MEPFIRKMRGDMCFWDDAKKAANDNKSVTFPKSEVNWYFHPLRFIEHLQKVELKEFNPYEGKEIPAFKKEDGDITGNHKENKPAFIVKSNPGFAPLANGQTIYAHDDNSYAFCTSPYGILRYSASAKNNRLAHSGIDLAPYGGKKTEVISFIYGEVWACTWADIYGNVMIVKNRFEDKLYLLAHLDEFKRKTGDLISPGQTVAICGGSAHQSYSEYPVHLHLEVRTCKSKKPDKVVEKIRNQTPAYHVIGNSGKGEELVWSPEYKDNKKIDPFNQDA